MARAVSRRSKCFLEFIKDGNNAVSTAATPFIVSIVVDEVCRLALVATEQLLVNDYLPMGILYEKLDS